RRGRASWTSSGCCGSIARESSDVWRAGWTAREIPESERANRCVCDSCSSPWWAENRGKDARRQRSTSRHRGRLRLRRTEAEQSEFTRTHCLGRTCGEGKEQLERKSARTTGWTNLYPHGSHLARSVRPRELLVAGSCHAHVLDLPLAEPPHASGQV